MERRPPAVAASPSPRALDSVDVARCRLGCSWPSPHLGVDSCLASTQFPLAVAWASGGRVQSRLVAPFLAGARGWITATTLGLSLPFIVADVLRFAGSPVPYSLAAYVALGGVLAGALQARLLRALPFARPAWWLVITPIGWLLAGSTVWLNELLPKNVPGLLGAGRYLAVVLAGGVVLGVASAVAWRLVRPSPAPPPAPAAR